MLRFGRAQLRRSFWGLLAARDPKADPLRISIIVDQVFSGNDSDECSCLALEN